LTDKFHNRGKTIRRNVSMWQINVKK